MGTQITFQNDLKAQFCQIKLEDGKRILISVAQGKIRVSTMKWLGTTPDKIIYEAEIIPLFDNTIYQSVIEHLNNTSQERPKYGFNQLDVFRVVLLNCKNLKDVQKVLSRFG